MLNFVAWFNPWTFVPFVALLLLSSLLSTSEFAIAIDAAP